MHDLKQSAGFRAPEKYRVTRGPFRTSQAAGNNGLFIIKSPNRKEMAPMRVIISDGLDWEHVSVSFAHRCPTWEEMCHIKGLFWGDEDSVMQLHPPKSEWVNNHSYCLHLWRPMGVNIPRPPDYMVGIKEKGVLA